MYWRLNFICNENKNSWNFHRNLRGLNEGHIVHATKKDNTGPHNTIDI